ncbi:MAG: hypothetical protein NTW30_02035 [Candidatus Aenigmarchaeota archaeon]|nr:hypothetical protein [Candidatus Aenigmarchaeota archaeon]
MLSEKQVNKLLESMYLIHEMLKSAHYFQTQFAVGSALSDQPSSYRKRLQDLEALKKTETEGIESLPRKREYKNALSILQQYMDRPGVKKLLGDVYEEYPELKEAKESEKRVQDMLTGPGDDQAS